MRQRRLLLCPSSPDEDELSVCVDCHGPTRPKKTGDGYTKRCDTCDDKKNGIYRAIEKYQSAKRKWSDIEEARNKVCAELDDLQSKRSDINDRIAVLNEDISSFNDLGTAVKVAKTELDVLLDY